MYNFQTSVIHFQLPWSNPPFFRIAWQACQLKKKKLNGVPGPRVKPGPALQKASTQTTALFFLQNLHGSL
jgi:hypothetical protein